MTDEIESTETPAKRFGLVMSWLPAPIIFLSTLMASVALIAFIYDGPDDDYLFLSLVALFGAMISLALAAAGYIVSGEFRFLPPFYSRRIKQALLVSPIAVPVLLVMLIEIIQTSTDEEVASASSDVSVTEPAAVDEKWYETEDVAGGRSALTNKVTGAYVVIDMSPSYKEGSPDFVAATVLDGQLIASASWVLDCEPNKIIASKITCSRNGKAAHTTFLVEEPQWGSGGYTRNNIKWEFNSSGFMVEENFDEWPLNEARQKDAFQLSHDVDRPSPRDVKHVMYYFNEGSELWEKQQTKIKFLDE